MSRRTRLLLVAIAFADFVAAGVPAGLLGVAWPSIRATFDLPLDAVGLLLTAMMAGALVAGLISGPLVARFGIGRALLAASFSATLGLAAYALAPAWWPMALGALLVGLAGGTLDPVLNLYFAANHSSRLMNWLHASYGVGATLGPVAMTAFLKAGISWRWGYALVALLQALLVLLFALTSGRWRGFEPTAEHAPAHGVRAAGSVLSSLTLPTVWLGIALFFLASGTEHSAGQWSFSLFTAGRGVAPATAGLWVSIYWGSLTVGRILYGLFANRLKVNPSMRASIAGTLAGAALIWVRGSDGVSFAGLALMGLAFAPIFPLLQLETPQRVGQRYAPYAIGLQTAAANLGHGLVPSAVGILAGRVSLEAVGPALVATSAAMLLVHEALVWQPTGRVAAWLRGSRRAARAGEPAQGPAGGPDGQRD